MALFWEPSGSKIAPFDIILGALGLPWGCPGTAFGRWGYIVGWVVGVAAWATSTVYVEIARTADSMRRNAKQL